MSERKEAVLSRHPEVVPGVILMVMCIDNDLGMKCIHEFQEADSTAGESRIDQQPIDEKGINLKKREARKPADHSNRIYRAIQHQMHRNPVHVLLDVTTTPCMTKWINSFVWFSPRGRAGLLLPYVSPLNSRKIQRATTFPSILRKTPFLTPSLRILKIISSIPCSITQGLSFRKGAKNPDSSWSTLTMNGL